MPNTNPPTSNIKEFQRKLDLAKNRMYCNYAFYFGATADNVSQLAELKNLEGCCGIKLFAGSSTGNLLVADEKDIDKVFQNSSKVVAVHSEDEAILEVNKKLIKNGDVHTHPVWRSEECAMSSTRRIVRLAERYNKKAHVLHITTKQEIDFLSQHKGNITFEITPQHLTIYAPDCYDKLGTYAQMNPPIRDKSHYDRLWYAVKNNLNDTIGSDHAPHLKVNKDKEYPNSPSGMPGVQTLMPVMLNHVNDGKLTLNQLINLASKMSYVSAGEYKLPLVIRAIIGRSWGQGAQHSQSFHSFFMHVPGIKVIAPSTPYDAKGALISAINDNNPTIFLEHRMLYQNVGQVPSEPYTVDFNKARILSKGNDVTIVAISHMVVDSLRARDLLIQKGIKAEVIDPVSLSPLDIDTIYNSVLKTKKIVVVDTSWISAGTGSEIIASLSEKNSGSSPFKYKRMGYEESPCPTTKSLENLFYPDSVSIAKTCYNLCAGKNNWEPDYVEPKELKEFRGPF